MNEVRIVPIEGVPEIVAGDDLAAHLVAAIAGDLLVDDVVVVAHKAVSKAEGRVVSADKRASARDESARVLRISGDMLISETRHGYVCANAGVDESNVPEGTVALLPLDPDLSARRLRAGFKRLAGVDVGVVIADTFGRPWRVGQTNVAIGVAGIEPFVDHRGNLDTYGRVMRATVICIADEIAAAAEMVMGKSEGVCAALVRGAPVVRGRGAAAQIVRPAGADLFR